MDQAAKLRRHFSRALVHKRAIVFVRRFRQFPAEHLAKAALAVVAMAVADRVTAVIGGLVPEHVEEQAVYLVTLQGLREYAHGRIAVVSAIDTG